MRRFFIALTRNPISLAGAAITTAAAIIIISLFVLQAVGMEGGPYLGILAFLILPAIFVVGLLLIPIGVRRHRRLEREARQRGKERAAFPVIDLNRRPVRRAVLTVLALTVVNVIILAVATYEGVHVMESNEFCGTACHSVMQPEFTAYQASPHSRVDCVQCHIGPGADWFVKSKLSGAWQVISVTFDLYEQPIPTPVHDLRPARETCEQCHWPQKFVGDRLRVITHFDDDEEVTELKTVLLMRVGGVQPGGAEGIHWHVDPRNEIRYRSDPSRETIYEVELRQLDGTVKTYLPSEMPEEGAETEWRVMDCVDCHNRPTHVYGTPEGDVDDAIAEGRIDRTLPYVRREGVAAVTAEYPSHAAAEEGIARHVESFYRDTYPEVWSERREAIDRAVNALAEVYTTSVFPSMNVAWNVYPNHIGHEQSIGCFRCHNEEHETADGDVISQDCFACHGLLAMEEEEPEILATLEY